MNLVDQLVSLRSREHSSSVGIVAALVELRRSEEHLALGYSSIFDFLVRHLHYSAGAASRRYRAMKCAERFPQVLDMLREHRVTLSSLATVEATLAECGDPEELLARIEGRPQREVEKEVARRRPVAKVRESVRATFVRGEAAPLFDQAEAAVGEVETVSGEPVEERVSVRFTLSAERYEAFERARAILARKLPPGHSIEEAFNELVDFYLKRKTAKPRARPAKGRKIPASLRAHVAQRDGHRCTFEGPEGRCPQTQALEVDHVLPVAHGGRTEPGNLRLLCAAHNRHRARREFGRRVPTRNSGGAREPRSAGAAVPTRNSAWPDDRPPAGGSIPTPDSAPPQRSATHRAAHFGAPSS